MKKKKKNLQGPHQDTTCNLPKVILVELIM